MLRPVQTCGRSDGFGTVGKDGETDYHKRVRDSKKIYLNVIVPQNYK